MVKRLGIFLHYAGWLIFVVAFGPFLFFLLIYQDAALVLPVIPASIIFCLTWGIRYVLCGYKDIRCWKAK